MDNKLSAIIRYKLPEFVRDDHEMFVAFIQAYYTWLEEEGNWLHYMNRFQRNLDVDRADDDFLEQYVKEFASTFPKATLIPTNQLLKLMREFYLAKGSEDSFRFIFTILYDTSIDIIYPREYMYIPSSGEYTADVIAYITGDNWFKLTIDNDDLNASIQGSTSGANAVIDTITSNFLDGQQILQLEISSYSGEFQPGENVVLTVDDTEVLETMYGSIVRVNVDDGGTNYKLSDPIDIVDTGTGQRAKAKISKIALGALTQVNITNAGTGYAVGDTVKAENVIESNGYGFRARVYEVGGSGEIVRIRIEAGGYDYSKKTTAKISSTGGGSGAVVELNGDDVGKIRAIEVTDGGINYSNAGTIALNIQSDEGIGAVLTPVLEGIFTAPKRYINEKSTPSGNSKIMDSYYYQQFSYVISSSVSPHKWLGQVKRIAHPAGTQLFGQYQLESEFEIEVGIAPGFSNAIGRNLSFVNFADIEQALTAEQVRTLIRAFNFDCQLGLTLADLDDMKFYAKFDWIIEDFQDYSIADVEQSCAELIEKQDSSEITIT